MAIGEYLGAGSGVTKGLYHLNGNANDSSGNGNNGTATNVTWVAGRLGSQCASLNGINSNIIVPHSAGLNITNDITISVLVKRQTQKSAYCAFVEKAYNTSYYFGEATTGGSLSFFYGGSQVQNDSGLMSNDIWYNCVVTYNRSTTTCKIYLNAQEVASNTSFNPTVPGNSTSVYIGTQATTAGREYKGEFDEIIIENRAWSASEVRKYYTYAKGRFGIIS